MVVGPDGLFTFLIVMRGVLSLVAVVSGQKGAIGSVSVLETGHRYGCWRWLIRMAGHGFVLD
jgi:hypothetical protein